MRKYEIMFIVKSDTTEEERKEIYQGWINAVRSVLYLTDLNKN